MVHGVLAQAKGRKIDKLTFIGHGHAGSQRVGKHAAMNDEMTGQIAPSWQNWRRILLPMQKLF
jgi:hypothetical protein